MLIVADCFSARSFIVRAYLSLANQKEITTGRIEDFAGDGFVKEAIKVDAQELCSTCFITIVITTVESSARYFDNATKAG